MTASLLTTKRRTRLALQPLESRLTPTGPVPVGPEFQVNTYTTGRQAFSPVAMDAAGNFVIGWDGEGAGDTQGIFAQRYNAAGVPQGSQFQMNAITAGEQFNPRIAMKSTGEFVVTWGTRDATGDSIWARRFNAVGLPLGAEFQVNTSPAFAIVVVNGGPQLAIDSAGNFVIAWATESNGTVYAQRFTSDGLPAGGEMHVSSTPYSGAQNIAMFPDGSFVITWDRRLPGDFDVVARRFDAFGQPLGTEFQVNTTEGGSVYDVATDQQGNFVIVWTSLNQVPGGFVDCFGRRFDSAGVPLTADFLINTTTTGEQTNLAIAVRGGGDFVVAWNSDQIGDRDTYARAFSADCNPLGPEFLVNTYTIGFQDIPGIAVAPTGDFVIAWSGAGNGDSGGVYAQRYRPGPPAVQSAQINDGSAQRSRVTSVKVNFDSIVTLPANPADAFQLRRLSDNGLVGLIASVTNDTTTHVTLSLTGGLTEFGSLSDGNYQLTILAAQVSNANGQLDGNGDGTPGDNYTFNFHRLFGDADGNRRIDGDDFAAFRTAYITGGPSIFDVNNDGQMNSSDFAEFRKRFGISLP